MRLNAVHEQQLWYVSLTLPHHKTERQDMFMVPLPLCFSGCFLRCIDFGHGLADLCCVQFLFFNLQSDVSCPWTSRVCAFVMRFEVGAAGVYLAHDL